MIASFSRALINELKVSMSDSEFDAALGKVDRRDLSGLGRQGLKQFSGKLRLADEGPIRPPDVSLMTWFGPAAGPGSPVANAVICRCCVGRLEPTAATATTRAMRGTAVSSTLTLPVQ